MRVGSDFAVGPRSHVVQFYGCEEDLTRGVGRYLADAINSGGVAMVVATPAHRQAFEEHLAGLGIDVAAARRAGTYATVDAEDAVQQFVVGGRVDAARFGRVIGRLVRDAVASGRPGMPLSRPPSFLFRRRRFALRQFQVGGVRFSRVCHEVT